MTISTLEQYAAAAKQRVRIRKPSPGFGKSSPTGGVWGDSWDKAGDPGAGSLSVGSKTQGIVPDNTTTGAPSIAPFSGTAYITGCELSVAGASYTGAAILVYDRLFHCGSYVAGDGTQTLAAQPGFSARLPGGIYTGLELFMESTSSTIIQATTVTYTDQAGNAGHSITFTPKTTTQSGWVQQVPLASGDSGIQKIESVTVPAAGGGFNLVIARRLFKRWSPEPGGSISFPQENKYGLEQMGMPQIYASSCLWALGAYAQGNTEGEVLLEVSAG